MANVKYVLNATDKQIESLKSALHVGSPLDVALKYSGISKATFYYWVGIASIVKFVKEQDFMHQQDVDVNSGVSFAAIKEKIQAENNANSTYRSSIDAFVEPTAESLSKYRTNKSYREFANKIYDIIDECDRLRSEIVLYHLKAIKDATKQRGMNSLSSQWFLERTMPETFGRFNNFDNENNKNPTAPVVVKFVDNNNKDSENRVNQMRKLVEDQFGYSDAEKA